MGTSVKSVAMTTRKIALEHHSWMHSMSLRQNLTFRSTESDAVSAWPIWNALIKSSHTSCFSLEISHFRIQAFTAQNKFQNIIFKAKLCQIIKDTAGTRTYFFNWELSQQLRVKICQGVNSWFETETEKGTWRNRNPRIIPLLKSFSQWLLWLPQLILFQKTPSVTRPFDIHWLHNSMAGSGKLLPWTLSGRARKFVQLDETLKYSWQADRLEAFSSLARLSPADRTLTAITESANGPENGWFLV